jgi:hypothetical protein
MILIIFLLGAFLNDDSVSGFRFPAKETKISVINLILRTYSIFVTITFSFIILSYNQHQSNFDRYSLFAFFRTKSIKKFWTLFLGTLFGLVYTYYYLIESGPINSFANYLFSISIIACAYTLLSLLNSVRSLLAQSNSRTNIVDIVKLYNEDWYQNKFERQHNYNKFSNDKFHNQDPRSILYAIAKQAVSKLDYVTIDIIITELNQFIEDKNYDDIGATIFNELVGLSDDLIKFSITNSDQMTSKDFIYFRFRLEKLIMDNSNINSSDYMGKYMGWTFNFIIEEFYRDAVKHNLVDLCDTILMTYNRFGQKIIKDILPKRNHNPDLRHHTHNTETSMVHTYFNNVTTLCEISLELSHSKAQHPIFNIFSTIERVSIDSYNTIPSKLIVLRLSNSNKYSCITKLIESGKVKSLQSLQFPYHLGSVAALSQTTSEPIEWMLQSLKLLLHHKQLNGMALNTAKAVTLGGLDKFNEYSTGQLWFQNVLLKIVSAFVQLKISCELGNTLYHKSTYILIYKYLKIISYHANRNEYVYSDALLEMNTTLMEFDKLDSYRSELNSVGYQHNDNIV